jgi:hypothetical protein
MGWTVGDLFPRSLIRGLTAETLNFAATVQGSLTNSTLGNIPWNNRSSQNLSGGGKKYQVATARIEEPDPYNAGQTIQQTYMLYYIWPNLQSWDNHSLQVVKSPQTILKTWNLGNMSSANRSSSWTSTIRDDIVSYWNTTITPPETCDQSNTYIGAKTECSDGGFRCTDNSQGLVAGTTTRVQWGNKGQDYTVPQGTVICPGQLSSFTPCQDNQEKVLSRQLNYGSVTGWWTCVNKSACGDEHDVNYKDPALYNKDNSLCGTCIEGAQKKWYGVSNGSCMLKIDEWIDSEGTVKLLLGKSGWNSGNRYYVIFDNFKGDLSGFQSGSSGFKSYDTEAKARLAFNQAANIRKEELNPSTDDDDDDQDNYQNYIEPTSEGSFPWIPVGLGAAALLLILR